MHRSIYWAATAVAAVVLAMTGAPFAGGQEDPVAPTPTPSASPTPSVEAAQDPCPTRITRHEYRVKAKRVYHRKHVRHRARLRLQMLRACQVHPSHHTRKILVRYTRKVRAAHRYRAMIARMGVRGIAYDMLRRRGALDQYGCLVALWGRESGWSVTAHNRSSGAHGIPQALPGSKMSSAGPNWWSNPYTQIRWGIGYIYGRFGSPCAADAFQRSHNYY